MVRYMLLNLENFAQASADYGAALEILLSLLPPFARRLSDGYLRLGLALEFHPDAGEREKATGHVEQAAHILQRRLVELEKLKDGTEQGVTNASSDAMFTMDSDQLELEVRDVKELLGDLEIKVRCSTHMSGVRDEV